MKTRISKIRHGFTLVELITAMAITSILVLAIMQLTNQGIALWKVVQQDVSTAASSRVALQIMSRDMESFQMAGGNNKYQWMYAKINSDTSGAPKSLPIPKSAQCVFFACAPDRNPSVSSSASLRSNYRDARAHNMETQGDVNTIGYRLMYRDQILNLPGREGDETTFPLFSLYRQVIAPRETYEQLLGKENMEQAYVPYEEKEEENFLCENIVELSIIFTIQYPKGDADAKTGRASYETVTVPVISSRKGGSGRHLAVYGDRIEANGQTYENARIQSANLSITVLTEEGVALAEQVRRGRRRAPKPADFFARYTRSYSRLVALPQPL